MNNIINITKLSDVRIEYLEPFKVISSYTKESNGEQSGCESKPEQWNEVCKRMVQQPRGYFEFPNPFQPGQMVEIYKVPSDYNNDTEFIDFTFEGGLFAITVSYAHEIGQRWEKLKDWINENENFALDTLSYGGSRAEVYGNPLTPKNIHKMLGETLECFQWDLLVPIKIKC